MNHFQRELAVVLTETVPAWLPPMKEARDGTVTLRSDRFLRVPEKMRAWTCVRS